MAVHDRPAAFEGSDGFSYSVEIVADETPDGGAAFGAYLLFIQWARVGAAARRGTWNRTISPTRRRSRGAGGGGRDAAGRGEARAGRADRRARRGAPARRWWDAMRADDPGDAVSDDAG